MRVLVLGGDGMLGHRLLKDLAPHHDVKVTLRRSRLEYERFGLFTAENSFDEVEVRDHQRLAEVFAATAPDVVINAVGIVKQHRAANEIVESLEVNALLPHRLASLCDIADARLIHISTDCVFAGDRGNYAEDSIADALDIYGRTKHLGEVSGPGCLTIRTSMIGLELHRKLSLVEWYLAQTGKIRGFKNAIFTGLTTAEIGRVLKLLIKDYPQLSGVYHVAAQPISKYDLLKRLTELAGRKDVVVEPDTEFHCDRSLIGERFSTATGYKAPDWDTMLTELAGEIRNR